MIFDGDRGKINLGKISNLCSNKYFLYTLMSIFFAFLALFVKKHYGGYITLAIYSIIGILIYLAITPYKFKQSSEYNTQPIWMYIGLILFFVAYGLSIAYLRFFEPSYGKSLWYYILIGICTSSIFLISQLNKETHLKSLLPFLVVLLGLNIYLSNLIVFPHSAYASGDTHWQIYNMVLPIIENGGIPLDTTYTFYPHHQINVAALAMTTGLDPVLLYLSAIGILYAISALFIYLLGRRILDSKFGIVSMLMYLIAPEIVYLATHAYQFSYALPLAIIVLFCTTLLLLPDSSEKMHNSIPHTRVSWIILYIIFFIALVWTHYYTSLLVLLCIFILFLVVAFILKSDGNIRSFCYTTLSLYGVVLLAHWMYAATTLATAINVLTIYHASLFSPENYQSALLGPISSSNVQPFWLIFLDISGKGVMFMLTIVGALYGMWRKNIHVFALVVYGIFGWTLISFGCLIQMPLLQRDRLMALLLAISIVYLAALGCTVLIKRLGKKGIILCCLLLFIMPSLCLGSAYAGTETSLFLGETPSLKLYDTSADLQYRAWIQRTVPAGALTRVSEAWVPQFSDKARIYTELPINNQDQINVSKLEFGEFLVLSKHDFSGGLRVRGLSEQERVQSITEGQMTTVEAYSHYSRMMKLGDSELNRVNSQLGRVYSNGETNLFVKYSHTKWLSLK